MRFKNLRNTAAGWAATDKVIGQGEIALVVAAMPTGTVTEMRLGDGVSVFSALTAFSTGGGGGGGSGDLLSTNNLSDVANAAAALSNIGAAAAANPALSGTGTGALNIPDTWVVTTASPGDNTTKIANTAYVMAAIAALINAAPGALDTLDELSAALGDDANFAATMTTTLAGKQPLAADLTAIAALTSATNKVPYATGAGAWALADFTAAGRTLVAAADAAAQRTALALGNVDNTSDANKPVSIAQAAADALKANAASPVFTGPVTSPGAQIIAGAAMGALVIDVTKEINTKSISADSTFTFSTTPTADTWFGLALTNTDTNPHVATIPSSKPEATNVLITTVNVPAGATIYLTWRYTGSAYQVFGSGVPPGLTILPKSAAYTLVAGDANTMISHPAADTTARIWTIPANASVPFEIGTFITFDNENAAGALTVAITTDTLEWVPTGATGSRTVATGGQFTVVKVGTTKWRGNGVGVT